MIYLGIFVGYFTIGYLFPKFFSKEEFGLTRVILSIATVIAVFARAGFSAAIMRYFPYFRDNDKKHNGFLLFVLLIPIFSYIIVALIYVLIKPLIIDTYIEKSPLFIDYFYYVLPVALFISYTLLVESHLKALMDIAFSLFVKEIMQRLFIMIAMLLFIFKLFGFESFMIAFVCAHALSVVILLIYLKVKGELYLQYDKAIFASKKIKEFVVYGLYMMLSGGANILATNIDTIMLGALSGLDKTAIYTVSMYFGRIIAIPRNTLASISASKAARLWKDEKYDEVLDIYKRTSILQITFGLLIFCVMWANVDNIYRFIPHGGQFSEGKYVLLFIALANLFRIATSINTQLIAVSPSYRFNFWIMIGLVFLTIGTNYVFIPKYGITGAAFATALTIFLHNFAKVIFLWIKYKMQPFKPSIFVVLALGALSVFACSLIPFLGEKYLDLIVRTVISGTLFIVPVYFLKISDDINGMVKMMLSRVGIKLRD